MKSPSRRAGAALAALVLLAACSPGGGEDARPAAGGPSPTEAADAPATTPDAHGDSETPHAGADDETSAPAALREGEQIVDVTMPAAYTPAAPNGGTDDYRCFLLDPELDEDAFVTGVDVAPGDEKVVHHVILFRVPPGEVAAAEAVDREAPGQGWTCFGGSGLEGADFGLDSAPWLGAWAPGGGERILAEDIGMPLEAGSRIVMQVHYNLLAGSEPDLSSARLRLATGDKDLQPLETMLMPAPVELPCRPGTGGPLCDRESAILDVMSRFGPRSGQTVAGLQLLCGEARGPRPGSTQSCTRGVREAATIRATAGHMHLLGRSITIELNPDGPDARTLLDIPVWDFDDQGARALASPVRVEPGDELRVTCTHDQSLRDLLPAFEGQPDRYVVWGEGTTDEMCLGLVLLTRP